MTLRFDLLHKHARELDLEAEEGDPIPTLESLLLFHPRVMLSLFGKQKTPMRSLHEIFQIVPDENHERIAMALLSGLRCPPVDSTTPASCMLGLHLIADQWDVRWYWGGLRHDVLGRALCLAGVLHSYAWKHGP